MHIFYFFRRYPYSLLTEKTKSHCTFLMHGFWKDGLLAELRARMSIGCRFLLFLKHKCLVILKAKRWQKHLFYFQTIIIGYLTIACIFLMGPNRLVVHFWLHFLPIIYVNFIYYLLRLSSIVRGKKWVISQLRPVLSNGPIMFHTGTVSHKRWDPTLLYRTSLSFIMLWLPIKSV